MTITKIKQRKKLVGLLLSFAGVLVQGCTFLEFGLQGPDPRGHYVLAHKDGYPVDIHYNPLGEKEFIEQYVESTLRGIDKHVEEACSTEKKCVTARILVFVHGGLNPYETGLARVQKLLQSEGKTERTNRLFGKSTYYPVFINWNSSFGSSVYDDLLELREGYRVEWWFRGMLYAPFLLASRVAESAFTIPSGWWYMWENWKDTLISAPEREKAARKQDGYINKETVTRYSAITAYPFLFPLRGLTQPAIQSFGSPAWRIMKGRADLVMARSLPTQKKGSGWILMEEIRKRTTNKDGKVMWKTTDSKERGPIEITLVGHSMGALVLDRILQVFPTIHFHQIIYLAPASSIEDFETVALPYLSRFPSTKLWILALSRIDEAWENYPFPFNFVVDQGSLLTWIDSFFEDVATPRQRRLGKYRNLELHYGKEARSLDAYLGANIKLVKFDGKQDEPIEHGDFDDAQMLRKVLCMVDPRAFDAVSCTDSYEP